MITMKEKQEVILRFFRDGDSKSKISRDLQLHRQTVRAYITEYLDELKKGKTKGTHAEGSLAAYVSESPKYKSRTTPKVALTYPDPSRYHIDSSHLHLLRLTDCRNPHHHCRFPLIVVVSIPSIITLSY